MSMRSLIHVRMWVIFARIVRFDEKNKSEYKAYLNCVFDRALLAECNPNIFPTTSLFVSKKIEFYYKTSVFLTFFDELAITFLEIH